jgi:hypothetical protein
MFSLSGFVKALFSRITSRIISAQKVHEVYTPKIEYRTSLRGFIEYRKSANGVRFTKVNKIYCNGELISGEITCHTLRPDTFLISATAIDRNVVQITVIELATENGLIRLKEHEKDISETLLNAIGEVYDICRVGNTEAGCVYYDNDGNTYIVGEVGIYYDEV